MLRGRLNEKFARGAENQSLLVETVTGIQTVKANALEPQMARRWDNQLAAYVSASHYSVMTKKTSAMFVAGPPVVAWTKVM